MDFKPILIAAAMIGGMGLIFGALLAIVSRIFHVEEDPRKELVREQLPGANCGGCGYAGCDAYAQEIVAGKAPLGKCPVAGDAAVQQIARIMGVEAQKRERRIATVRCRGSLDRCGLRFDYKGPKDWQKRRPGRRRRQGLRIQLPGIWRLRGGLPLRRHSHARGASGGGGR